MGENLNTMADANSGFCGRWTEKSCVSAVGTSNVDISTNLSEYPGGTAEGAYVKFDEKIIHNPLRQRMSFLLNQKWDVQKK